MNGFRVGIAALGLAMLCGAANAQPMTSAAESDWAPFVDLMLLTTSAGTANTGSEWNAQHSVYAKWGQAPSLIEPVRGWIQLRDLRVRSNSPRRRSTVLRSRLP